MASVPTPVVAQAWRSGRDARLALVLRGCREVPPDPAAARRAGELCERAGSADVVKAFVVLGAADRGEDILTGDPEALRVLAAYTPGIGRVRTLDELGPAR